MDKRLMHYQFPRDQIQLDGNMAELRGKVAAVVEDSTDIAIVAAILAAARAEGVTDLYLLDKTFILDAIREKRERENPKPLTIDPAHAKGACRCHECQHSYKSSGSSTGYVCECWGVYDIDCECDPNGFCYKGTRRTDHGK